MPDDEMKVSPEEAEAILLQRLAERQREAEAAVWELVRFYSHTGRQPLAKAYVERLMAEAEDSGKRAFLSFALGQLMEQVRDYGAAIEAYTAALALEPADPAVWYFINNNLGYCLNHFSRYEEAEARCRAAIQVDPSCHNAHKNLGIALEGQGQFEESAQCYLVAAQAQPADPRSLRLLEDLLARHPEVKPVSEKEDL
jgi:tetratricopeptide (TPR) repeat protein